MAQNNGNSLRSSGRRSGDQEARNSYSLLGKLLFTVGLQSESCVTLLTYHSDTFWVDVVLRNPLNVEVTISGLTVLIQDAKEPEQASTSDLVEVEVIDDLVLGARESRTVSDAAFIARYCVS